MRCVNSEFHALFRCVSPCVRFVGERRESYPSKPFAPFLSVCHDFWTAHHFERNAYSINDFLTDNCPAAYCSLPGSFIADTRGQIFAV